MLAAKLKMLKNLQKQMHCLMAEGHGDDEDAGADAVAKVGEDADDGEELAEKVAEGAGEANDEIENGADDELAAERKSFFKNTGKIKPKAGALVVMVAGKPKASPPGGKAMFAAGMKPGKRHG